MADEVTRRRRLLRGTRMTIRALIAGLAIVIGVGLLLTVVCPWVFNDLGVDWRVRLGAGFGALAYFGQVLDGMIEALGGDDD